MNWGRLPAHLHTIASSAFGAVEKQPRWEGKLRDTKDAIKRVQDSMAVEFKKQSLVRTLATLDSAYVSNYAFGGAYS